MSPDSVTRPTAPGWPIRAHLAIFAVMLLAPAIAFSLFLIDRNRAQQLEQAEARVVQLANDLADDVSRELERTIALLEALALSASLERDDLATFREHARRVAEGRYDLFVLVEPDGRQLVNTRLPWGSPLPLYGSPASLARVVAEKQPVVSDVFVGRTVGSWVVNVLQPVLRGGEVHRVLLLSLSAERIRHILESQSTDVDWISTVTDASGIVIARTAAHEAHVGKPLAKDLTAARITPRKAQRTLDDRSEPLYIGVAPTRLGGWTVYVSVRESRLSAEVNRSIRDLALAGLALFALSAALVGLYGAQLAYSIRVLSHPVDPSSEAIPVTPVREANVTAELLARATSELKVANARLEGTLAAAEVGTWTYDVGRGVSQGDANARRLFGFDATDTGEIPRDAWLSRMPEADRQRVEIEVCAALAENRLLTVEHRVVLPDDRVRWIALRGRMSQTRFNGISIDITERREVEARLAATAAALRDREEALRLALLAARAVTFTWDVDDAPSAAPLGMQAPAKAWAAVVADVHPEDREAFIDNVRQALALPAEAYRSEYRVVGTAGEVRWIEAWGRVEPAGPGGVPRLTGISMDVTERKQAALAVERSEERLRLASEAAGFGTYHYDGLSGENTWSGQAKAIAGLPPDEPASMERVLNLIHVDDRARVEAAMRTALADGGSVEFEDDHRLVRPDGVVRWVRVKGRTFRDQRGRTLRAAGTIVDITDRKSADQALVESERRFRELADSMPQIVWTADARGRLTYVNKQSRAYRAVRNSRGHWRAVIHPDDFGRTRELWRSALEAGTAYECEQRVQRADGSYRWQLSRARPVAHGGGVVWYGTATDIHDLKEREERIRLLMREVNHRAKNLLAVVLSIAKQTAREGSPGDFVNRLTERVTGLAASQDLLVKSEWRGVELVDLVHAQLAHYQNLIGSRISVAGPSLVVTANAAQVVGMALHELATNAAKHGALSNETGRIELAWRIEQAQSASEPALVFRWAEHGGPPVQPPERSGFGQTVLVRTVEHGLSGRVVLNYAESGFVWELTAPLERLAEASVSNVS